MSVTILTHCYFAEIVDFSPQDVTVRVFIDMYCSRMPFKLIKHGRSSLSAFHRYVKSCYIGVVTNCSRYSINLRGGPSSLQHAERPGYLTLVLVVGA